LTGGDAVIQDIQPYYGDVNTYVELDLDQDDGEARDPKSVATLPPANRTLVDAFIRFDPADSVVDLTAVTAKLVSNETEEARRRAPRLETQVEKLENRNAALVWVLVVVVLLMAAILFAILACCCCPGCYCYTLE